MSAKKKDSINKKYKVKDKRLKFQKYFNMGNIFTILDDIWDWICLNAEVIVATLLCVSMMAILLGGMICLLLWSGNTDDESGSISDSISSSVENSIESSSTVVNVVSDK